MLTAHIDTFASALYDARPGVAIAALEAPLMPMHDAAKAQGQRGLAATMALLGRSMSQHRDRLIDEDDAAGLGVWLSQVQALLDGVLMAGESGYVLESLQFLPWFIAPPQSLAEKILTLLEAESAAARAARISTDEGPRPSVVPDPFVAEPLEVAPDRAEPIALEPSAGMGLMASQTPAPIETEPEQMIGATIANDDAASELKVVKEAVIWIATEEFFLISETVHEQILPALMAVVALDPATPMPTDQSLLPETGEAVYRLQLVGNACEVLGLAEMADALTTVQQGFEIVAVVTEAAIELAASIAPVLLSLAELGSDPTSDTLQAELLGALGDDAFMLDANLLQRVADELRRIRVGADPQVAADRKSVATADDVRLSPAEDVLPSVLEGMYKELPLNAQALSDHIQAFVAGDLSVVDEARRVAHTLKGDANTVGIRGIAALTHALEEIFIVLNKRGVAVNPSVADVLVDAADCLATMSDHLLGNSPPPDNAQMVLQRVLDLEGSLLSGDDYVASATHLGAPTQAPQGSADAERTASKVDVEATLQVPVSLLERLLDLSSEALVLLKQTDTQLSTTKRRHRDLVTQLGRNRDLNNELDDLVSLRGVALQSTRERGLSVDPLELDQYNELHTLTRQLVEVGMDEREHNTAIDVSLRRLDEYTREQERVQRELQDVMTRTREVRVNTVSARFQRTARQTAKTLGKDVDFIVEGDDTAVDRFVLDRLVEPLMHALRNAIDHGIETPELRDLLGKPPAGKVTLSFRRDGRAFEVVLRDDGRGLDYFAIAEKAREKELIAADAKPDEAALVRILFLPGFSTRDEATHVSGRGIGMDVVYQRILALRGTVDMRSKSGAGTTLTIRLPASLLTVQIGLTAVGAHQFGIATDAVEEIILLMPQMINRSGDHATITRGGATLQVLNLRALLVGQDQPLPALEKPAIGVVTRLPDGRGFVGYVDAISELSIAVLKSLGEYVAPIPAIRGATILGDGTVAAVVDPRELMRLAVDGERTLAQVDALLRDVAPRPRLVIADDSLSVRRSLEQLFSDIGFEVDAAFDGLDALTRIEKQLPNLVLLDLEMPRMNGLELAKHLKTHSATQHLPIVMITSRISERHREMARAAGVDHLLGKPYGEEELINLVEQLLEESTR